MVDGGIISRMRANLARLELRHVKILLMVVLLFGVYGLFANNIRNLLYEREIKRQFELFTQRYAVDFEDQVCELRSC